PGRAAIVGPASRTGPAPAVMPGSSVPLLPPPRPRLELSPHEKSDLRGHAPALGLRRGPALREQLGLDPERHDPARRHVVLVIRVGEADKPARALLPGSTLRYDAPPCHSTLATRATPSSTDATARPRARTSRRSASPTRTSRARSSASPTPGPRPCRATSTCAGWPST